MIVVPTKIVLKVYVDSILTFLSIILPLDIRLTDKYEGQCVHVVSKNMVCNVISDPKLIILPKLSNWPNTILELSILELPTYRFTSKYPV